MKGIWACLECGERVKSDDQPGPHGCDKGPYKGFCSCEGPGQRGECDPGKCLHCDKDRKFLAARSNL